MWCSGGQPSSLSSRCRWPCIFSFKCCLCEGEGTGLLADRWLRRRSEVHLMAPPSSLISRSRSALGHFFVSSSCASCTSVHWNILWGLIHTHLQTSTLTPERARILQSDCSWAATGHGWWELNTVINNIVSFKKNPTTSSFKHLTPALNYFVILMTKYFFLTQIKT